MDVLPASAQARGPHQVLCRSNSKKTAAQLSLGRSRHSDLQWSRRLVTASSSTYCRASAGTEKPFLAQRARKYLERSSFDRVLEESSIGRPWTQKLFRTAASEGEVSAKLEESAELAPSDVNGSLHSEDNGVLLAKGNLEDVKSLRAALAAMEKRALAAEAAKESTTQALREAEARVQQYAANMISTTEAAMKEIEEGKEAFKAELERVSKEKRETEVALANAQSDAVQLAVKVERMAEIAIAEATQAAAEQMQLRIVAAQTNAADAKVAVEQRVRRAADEAASAVITEARATIEDALSAASVAREQARAAEAALSERLGDMDKRLAAETALAQSEEAKASLERQLRVAQMQVEELQAELQLASARAEVAERRIGAAEAAVADLVRKEEFAAAERDSSMQKALASLQEAADARQEAARISYEAEASGLRSNAEAAQHAAKVKEQAMERRYTALEKSLVVAENQADAWRARALAVEELLRQLKDKGFDVLREAGEAQDVMNGGRLMNLLGTDSARWEYMAKGPRRETAQSGSRAKIEPPREAPKEEIKVELPSPTDVWSIADYAVPFSPETDNLAKEVAAKVALEEDRVKLEKGLAKRTSIKAKRPAEHDDKWESGTGSGQEIVLQGFHWESWRHPWYAEIAAKATDIGNIGFTCVWLPPPTESVSPQGYMPSDLYNLNSAYGTEQQLRDCIAELHAHDIQVLGDVVLNHRCAAKQDQNGIWNIFGGKLAWGPNAIVRDDPNFCGQGNPSSGDFFHAAPNIDHSQDFVRKDIIGWLNWLRNDIGYDGWRLDFVRGFWGGWVKEYIEASKPSFAIGEYWDSLSYTGGQVSYNQDAHRQRIINWINATGGTASAFDVTTKGILHSALHNEYWRLIDPQGKPPGVMGWWPSRAVTFLENHDTGSTQGHWPFPRDKLLQGYAYILTHPGTPTVFYDHLYDFGLHDQIQELIAARTRAGIQCRSPVKIMQANADGYVAQVGNDLVVKLGHLDWTPAKQNNLLGNWGRTSDYGHDFQIWERK